MPQSGCLVSLAKYLQKNGFKTYRNQRINGVSGIKHKFDIIAVKKHKTYCIEFYNPEIPILAIIGKAIDLPNTKIIAIAKKATTYDTKIKNLTIIKHENTQQTLEKIKNIIQQT